MYQTNYPLTTMKQKADSSMEAYPILINTVWPSDTFP